VNYTRGDSIPDSKPVIRWISPFHINPDDTINPEAFRPTDSDLKDGVSVELFELMTNKEIENHRFARKQNASAGFLLAMVPNRKGYQVKFTSKVHCVINSDVRQLQRDEQTLLTLANSTRILFNPFSDLHVRELPSS
jgi:hypothetical protein